MERVGCEQRERARGEWRLTTGMMGVVSATMMMCDVLLQEREKREERERAEGEEGKRRRARVERGALLLSFVHVSAQLSSLVSVRSLFSVLCTLPLRQSQLSAPRPLSLRALPLLVSTLSSPYTRTGAQLTASSSIHLQ